MTKENAMKILKELHDNSILENRIALEILIPELADSNDERIRKCLIDFFEDWHENRSHCWGIAVTAILAWLEKQGSNPTPININKMVMEYSQTKDGDFGLPVNCQIRAYRQGLTDAISTLNLGKQGSSSVKWQKNTPDNKPAINHSVLMKTTQGIAEGEWNGKEWIQYRWLCTLKDNDVIAWMELSDLDEQGEQKPVDKVEPFDKYEGLTDFERTLADICIGWIGEELGWKQYIKDNADVLLKIAIKMFNSIQDAPFEKKSAWSDEDEENLQHCCMAISADSLHTYEDKQEMEVWLKRLKNRIGG